MRLLWAFVATIALLTGWASAAKAHPLAPLGLEVRELAKAQVLVKLTRARKMPARARFAPRLPALRASS